MTQQNGAGETARRRDERVGRDQVAAQRPGFDGRPIPAADLDQILEAGRRSPSSQNWQPWDFVVITSRPQLTELAKVWRGGGHVAQCAATVALIAPAADERRRAQFDLGQATMSMMLAAAGLGIGSGHSAVGDQDLARRLLGFPEDRTCAFLIPLGYPAGRPLAPISLARPAPVRRGRALGPLVAVTTGSSTSRWTRRRPAAGPGAGGGRGTRVALEEEALVERDPAGRNPA